MIGVFDSGLGGLAILRALVKAAPKYSYLYLADSARAPYGSRTAEELYAFTLEGVEYLFAQGCPLVILGCNTASAIALRRIQQEVLPAKYPDRRVLGILVPTVEQVSGVGWTDPPTPRLRRASKVKVVGVLATEQTVASGAYEREIHKRNPNIRVVQQACPELVPLIESGAFQEEIIQSITKYVVQRMEKVQEIEPDAQLEAILLGCTHYALVADLFRALLPKGVTLYEQPAMVAKSLSSWLTRHPEMTSRLKVDGTVRFITSGNVEAATRVGSQYWGAPITFEHINSTKVD